MKLLASLIVWFVVWEIAGRLKISTIVPPFSAVIQAGLEIAPTGKFANAAIISLRSYGLGMAFALLVGADVIRERTALNMVDHRRIGSDRVGSKVAEVVRSKFGQVTETYRIAGHRTCRWRPHRVNRQLTGRSVDEIPYRVRSQRIAHDTGGISITESDDPPGSDQRVGSLRLHYRWN